jgi:membrane-bound ClpP family serine protease
MPTRAGERPGLGAAAKAVSERISAIVRLELDLAVAELKRKVVALGLGIALVLGAAILALFMLGFLLAAAAVALAIVLPTWAALLVTAGILLLVSGALGFVGVTALAKGSPPVPEQAIEEAKLTTEALKNAG